MVRAWWAVAAGLAAGSALPAQAADAVAGKSVFVRCSICHAVEPGVNKLGPSLSGILGRKAGAVPGYNYSPAMTKSGIVWNEAKLDAFIKAPRAVVPGTKMAFAGIPSDTDRANLLAYLAGATKAKGK